MGFILKQFGLLQMEKLFELKQLTKKNKKLKKLRKYNMNQYMNEKKKTTLLYLNQFER